MLLLVLATLCPLFCSSPTPPAADHRDCLLGSNECPVRTEPSTDPSIESYRAVRELRAANGRHKVEGWMEAWTECDAAGGFTFGITAEGGSGYIRNKVLRKVLQSEGAVVAPGERSRGAITSANYVFGEPVPVGQGLLRISLQPRRKDTLLVEGAMFIREADGDLVRVEGRLSKPPSFWTRRVDVVRTYGRIDGHRVALETTSTADVLVAGESTFTMRYRYESINGRPVTMPADAAGGSAR